MRLSFATPSRLLLLLCGLSLAAAAAHAQAALSAPAQPKPSVSIFFSKEVLPQQSTLQADLWFSNDSDFDLRDVNLHLSAPVRLDWYDGACVAAPRSSTKLSGTLLLGPVAAGSTLHHTLCLQSGSSVEPGDFSIPFVFEASWGAAGKSRRTIIAAEKPLKVALFGSDTLAGIPLALAGLIVPGLFFWIVLECFRVSWGVGLALGEKMIYSVLVSVGILAVGAWLSHHSDATWLRYLDLNEGMSVAKLFWMALSGAVLGAAIGAANLVWRHLGRIELEQRVIRISDDTLTLLGKLLRQKPRSQHPRTMVRLKNGETYCGSLGVQGAELTALVGWFRVEAEPAQDKLAQSLKPLADKGEMLRVFEAANGKLKFVTRNNVEQLQGGKLRNIADDSLIWNNDEVARITTWETTSGDGVISLP